MILAKHHVEAVALYLQPQRAAFPDVVGAAVVGVGVGSTGPRGMSGDVQGATLPQTEALTPLRHATAPTESVRG
jgi:hypothetical protein